MIQAFWDGFLAGLLVCLFLWASLMLTRSPKRDSRFCRSPFQSLGLQWRKAAAGKFESSFSTQ